MNKISRNIAHENPETIANQLLNKMEYRDGLQEIAIGVLILLYAGLAGLQAVLSGSNGMWALLWGCLLLMPMGFVSQWSIKKVRQRFMAGKVGYVKLKPINRKRLTVRIGIILGSTFVISALAALVIAKAVVATFKGGGVAHWGLFSPTGWGLVGLGIFGSVFMVFRIRLLRYAIGGVCMAALSILLAFSRVSFPVGSAILYAFPGLLALVSGSILFFLVLRQPVELGD